jgi:hypothetical protein
MTEVEKEALVGGRDQRATRIDHPRALPNDA